MKLSEISTLARYLSDTDDNDLTNARLLILVNNANERLHAKLITELAYSGWSFGDSNYSSLPTGKKTLVAGTQSYQLMGDFTGSTGIDLTNPLLTVRAVSVADINENYQPLHQITEQDIRDRFGVDPEEFLATNGKPIYYTLKEDFVKLYPAPDAGVTVTLTNGLKIDFDRRVELFTDMTSATVNPGLPPQAHEILAYEAALTHCGVYKPERVNFLARELERRESQFFDFMAGRNGEAEKVISGRGVNYR